MANDTDPIKLFKYGNVVETVKLAVQCNPVARETALPRILFGKISDTKGQVTDPQVIWKAAMNTKILIRVVKPYISIYDKVATNNKEIAQIVDPHINNGFLPDLSINNKERDINTTLITPTITV